MKYKDVSADTIPEVGGQRTVSRKLIVLHTTMGYNSLSWLQRDSYYSIDPKTGRRRTASCDFLIDRVGNIMQLTRPGRYAHHAGTSRWRFVQDMGYTVSMSAVGIEMEAAEHRGQRITDLQYIACAALLDQLMIYHGLMTDAIVTHAMVALPPGRKKDPMYLDWQVMMREMLEPSKEASGLVFPAVLP